MEVKALPTKRKGTETKTNSLKVVLFCNKTQELQCKDVSKHDRFFSFVLLFLLHRLVHIFYKKQHNIWRSYISNYM